MQPYFKLAKCNQEEFEKSGTNRRCIEARKLMIALPESFINYDHNKQKTNLHIHVIFAERKRLEQPEEKTAIRNMFYDERGHHVRTKKSVEQDGSKPELFGDIVRVAVALLERLATK